MKPFNVTHILAPIDLSDASVPALRYARLLADRFAAKLTLLHTDPVIYMGEYVGPAAGYAYPLTTPEHQARLRGDVEAQSAGALTGRAYDIDITVGQPVPAILAAANDLKADLIVMGTHRRDGWRRALLGSVTDGVLHGSTCPVLTIAEKRPGVPWPYAITNIMCPVNFTPVARESLAVATRVAQTFDARLTVVHVVESDDVTDVRADEQKVRQWIPAGMQDICSYRELVVHGGAPERLLDCADDLGVDLLVVGAQHRFFRDATVIGSTTERLVRFAPCPLLIAPRAADASEKKVNEESEVLAGAMS